MIEKYSFVINSASSANFGVATSTKAFDSELLSVVYNPSSSPTIAATSAYALLRRNTTLGDILARTSSGLAAASRRYHPRGGVMGSSALATSSLNATIPLAGDSVVCIRNGASSDGGNLLGLKVDCYFRGVS